MALRVSSTRQGDFDHRYRQLYTVQAQHYDHFRFDHAKGQAFNTNEQRVIHRLLHLAPGQTVLDVAAGTGRIAVYLAQQGLHVTALDLTHNMLLQAQARADASASAVRFVEGNGRALPLPDAQFDAVISIRFLHLLPVALHRPFIMEMWRVLKPGGVLLVQFDSATAAGVATWPREAYRRLVRGHKPRYYLWPQQVASLFEAIPNVSLHGSSPVGARFVRRAHPGSAAAMERALSRGWPSFLANRVFVRAIKPTASTNEQVEL